MGSPDIERLLAPEYIDRQFSRGRTVVTGRTIDGQEVITTVPRHEFDVLNRLTADTVAIGGVLYADRTGGMIARNLQPAEGPSVMGGVQPEVRIVPDNPWAGMTPGVAAKLGHGVLGVSE